MTAPNLNLESGESLVGAGKELLYRLILDWMMPGGTIMTHVFGPATSDNGKPSYARGKKTTAQTARDWHDANGRPKVNAVYAVAADEVVGAGLTAIDNSNCPEGDKPRSPGHCYPDFRDKTPVEKKSARFILYQRAMDRREIPTFDNGAVVNGGNALPIP